MTQFIKLQKFYNARMAENAASDAKYEIKINTMNGYMHFLKFQTTDVPVFSFFIIVMDRKLFLSLKKRTSTHLIIQ